MKLIDAVNFADFYVTIKDAKVPFKVAYKLANLSTRLDKEVEFYRSHLQEIISQYGQCHEDGSFKTSESGEGILIQPGKEEECANKFNELQSIDVDIEPVFTLNDLESFDLSANDMHIIMPFIKDEE